MSATSSENALLKAAGAVGALLPHLASIAIGISFIAYYAGWRDASAYFNSIGSPWVVSLLPASRLLYLSGELVSTILFCSFFSIHAFATGMVGRKGLSYCSAAVFICTMLFVALARWLPTDWASPEMIWTLSNIGGMCFAVGAGTTLGEVVSRLTENKLQWTTSHAYLVYIAFFTGIYIAPSQMGAARARYHLDAYKSVLPVAKLPSGSSSEDWRLLEAIGDSVVLMERRSATEPARFRVFKANEIAVIDGIATEPSR